jgi:Uncharacterized conserved protein
MKFVYPAIFTEEDGSYIVEFPDLEGCQTFADSISEAVEYAEEALSGYLLSLLEAEQIPQKATDIRKIKADEGFVSLVSCKIDVYKETKAVKKTLSIPAWLNNLAIEGGVNFSETLRDSLMTKLAK